TARTCSSVACDFMTTNISSPWRNDLRDGGCRRSRPFSLPLARSASQIGQPRPGEKSRYSMVMAGERDILKDPAPRRPPRLTSRRIGIHTSAAGGVQNAAERAYRLGCNTFQMFSSSPRQWAPYELAEPQCAEMNRLRAQYDLKPLVIHTIYLVNMASSNELFLHKS